VVNNIEHILKTHRAKLHVEQLIKLGDISSFGTVACCTGADNVQIWILDGMIIDREMNHTE